MTKRKSFVVISTTILLVALFVIGTTLAYLTDSQEAKNVLRIGQDANGTRALDITLREPDFIAQIDTERAKYPAAEQDAKGGKYTDDGKNTTVAELNNIMPGKKIQKDPTITNAGANSAYIRFKLVLKSDGSALTAAQEAILFKTTATGGLGLKINSAFVKNADGFYYYLDSGKNKALTAGSTLELFEDTNGCKMQVPATWTYTEIDAFAKVLNFDVVAEAVHADEYPDTTVPWVL